MKPVQITYITAGNGHKTAAMALREALNARNVPNVVTDIFNFSNTVFRWSYSDAYDFISEHSHLACRFVYELLDRDRKFQRRGFASWKSSVVNNVKGFMRFIEENMPDVALCTHYFPAMSSRA
jgi:processive 1,2-diacylglycerol beta-glucosyltransferase